MYVTYRHVLVALLLLLFLLLLLHSWVVNSCMPLVYLWLYCCFSYSTFSYFTYCAGFWLLDFVLCCFVVVVAIPFSFVVVAKFVVAVCFCQQAFFELFIFICVLTILLQLNLSHSLSPCLLYGLCVFVVFFFLFSLSTLPLRNSLLIQLSTTCT